MRPGIVPQLIGFFLFPWVGFLSCNLRARLPGSRCRSPGRLRHDSLLEIESPGRLSQVGLLRIGSLGRLRHVDLLGPLDWWIPEKVEA